MMQLLRKAIADLTQEIRAMRGSPAPVRPDADGPCSNASIADIENVEMHPADDCRTHPLKETASADLKEIQDEKSKAREELAELVSALERRSRDLNATEQALESAKASVTGLESRKDALENVVGDLERRQLQLSNLQAEFAALGTRLEVMRSEEKELEARERSIAAREAGLQQAMENTKHADGLLQKLWPAWLSCGELSKWRELIEQNVFSPDVPSSFSLLFASIHNYNASLRDPDGRVMLDSLRDLGRRLYQWLKDLDKGEDEMSQVAEAWAGAINSECNGSSTLQVALPGNPANNKWMSFTPRAGSSLDVISVRSWCVADYQGRPIHRAEVVV